MARPRTPQPPVHLVSARMLDIVSGELVEPGDLLVEGDRITGVSPDVGARTMRSRSTSGTSPCSPA